jgi:hypothetical protein
VSVVTSEARLCNLGLALCGETQFIDSLTQAKAAAQVAAIVYGPLRDSLLAAHPWKFATLEAALAPTLEARLGWEFAYAAPANMLAAQYIGDGTHSVPSELRIPFTKARRADGAGLLILTDQPDATLWYTANDTAPALYEAPFVEALTWALGSRFALAISKKPTLALELGREAHRLALVAAAWDLNQRRLEPAPAPARLRARS